MRALVTGGAGFIGSHLVEALAAQGTEVVVVDDLSSGRPERLPDGIALHRLDVVDAPAIAAVAAERRPDVVFHLAAQIDVRGSVRSPLWDARVNVLGTVAVLEAARHAGVRRVLLASTAGVYGDAAHVPTPEDAPLAPLSPYGHSKATAERYVALYRQLYGLSTATVRMANVYGPRQDPHGEAGVVAIFCGAATDGAPARIYGDGRQTRDYLYVGDAVRAFLAAAGSDAGGAFNVGSGRETTVVELAQALGLATVPAPGRAGEVARSCLDCSAAERVLGWRPTTALADGLRRTLDTVRRAA